MFESSEGLKSPMEEDSGVELVHRFFLGTGPTYDFMVDLCTLGFDRCWKKEILERIPKGSIQILDQACGTGILTFKIAQKFPRSRIVGVDLLEEYLSIAREKARRQKVKNVEFILGRAEEVLLHENFDCITSSYLAKYATLESLTRNAKRMLQSGGHLIMHDFTYPPNHAFAHLWEFYFRILQNAGRWKYPRWGAIFDGLPQLLRETKWVNELTRILRNNAFSDITVQSLTLGTSAIVTAKKD
jgi:demethylmenaquinone methyltransferase / 2-methoxy-6-polyprenyl-1,4-benzoquinol methylase